MQNNFLASKVMGRRGRVNPFGTKSQNWPEKNWQLSLPLHNTFTITIIKKEQSLSGIQQRRRSSSIAEDDDDEDNAEEAVEYDDDYNEKKELLDG